MFFMEVAKQWQMFGKKSEGSCATPQQNEKQAKSKQKEKQKKKEKKEPLIMMIILIVPPPRFFFCTNEYHLWGTALFFSVHE